MLITHQVLFEHNGSNSTTAKDPCALWENQVDLNETRLCCVSADWDMLIKVEKYKVCPVTLPDWMPVKEWIPRSIKWEYAWHCYDVDPNWPENWQRGLIDLDQLTIRAAASLLKVKKFKSNFRADQRARLEEWLNTPRENRKYNSPFSARQLECLTTYMFKGDAGKGFYYRNRELAGAPLPASKKNKAA